MRALRPWTWQIDYWGIACIGHSLLYGKYLDAIPVSPSSSSSSGCGSGSGSGFTSDHHEITNNISTTTTTTNSLQPRWKLKEPLKRYWQTEIWGGFFDACMNPVISAIENEEDGGGVMPLKKTLRKVRKDMEEWLEREGGKKGLKNGLRRLEERVNNKGK